MLSSIIDPDASVNLQVHAVVAYAVAAAIITYVIGSGLYNRYFHPLRNFPGPFLASITPLWYAWKISLSDFDAYQTAIHRKYGPLVRLAPNHIQVGDAREIDTIYGPKNNFWKSSYYDSFNPNITWRGDNFTITDDRVHSTRRRLVASLYTQSSALEYEDRVDRVISLVDEKIADSVASGEVMDLSILLRRYTFDVIGELFYGREDGFGAVKAGGDYNGWLELMEVIITPIAANSFIPHGLKTFGMLLQMLFPEKRAGILGFPHVRDSCIQAVKERVEYRATYPKSTSNDILSKLLSISDEKGAEFDHKDVATELFSVVFAGADTTATSLIGIFYLVHKHPDTLKKLKDEIDSAFANDKLRWPIRFQDAIKLPYLKAVVNETQRFHPAIGLSNPRLVSSAGVTVCGRFLPGGTEVGMNPPVVHMDSTVFGEDADTFNPDRWIVNDEKTANYMERHLLGFGYGKRICIGKHIAHIEMFKVLTYILYKYDFELVGDWTVKRDFFQQQKNMRVRVKERKGYSVGKGNDQMEKV